MNHLLRVALRVMVHYGVWEPDVICAALLHDAVEDHADELSTTGRPGAFAALAAVYGARVAELVAAVTNPVYAPGSDKDRQYREHVVDSLTACPWARVIKLSDFTDNGVGVIHTDRGEGRPAGSQVRAAGPRVGGAGGPVRHSPSGGRQDPHPGPARQRYQSLRRDHRGQR